MIKSQKNALTAIIALTICLAFSLSFFSGGNAFALSPIRALLLKPTTETQYFYMDEPYSLHADESNLYVTSFNRSVYTFTLNGAYVETKTLSANASKAVTCGTALFTLQNDVLTDNVSTALLADTVDIAASDSQLYAITPDRLVIFPVTEGKADTVSATTVSLPFIPVCVAVSDGGVYLSAASGKNSYRSDIYRYALSDGTLSLVYERAPSVDSMTARLSTDVLITLQGGTLQRYELKNGLLKAAVSVTEQDLRCISSNSKNIFALTGDGKILSFTFDLTDKRETVASSSSQKGFFNAPSFAATRKSSLFVADTGNNRIVRITGNDYSEIAFDFIMPTAVAVDNLGNIYVSHNMDTIEIFDTQMQHSNSFVISGAVITDLIFDSKNNLYAVSGGKTVYRVGAQQTTAQTVYEGGVTALTVAPDSVTPYILDNASKEIFALKENGAQKVMDFNCDAADFAVDIKQNFYLLALSGSIYKYSSADGYKEDISAPTDYESGFEVGSKSTKIILSTVKNESLNYGDIIVCDTLRHCIKKIDGAAFGVSVVDESFIPPAVDGDDTPNDIITDPDDPDYRIVRTALSDADVYEKPIEMSPFYKIAQGRKVIVASYELEESDAFAFVLIDDLSSSPSRLVAGYVYKVLLSDPLPYEPPAASDATTYNDRTPVYKWPSRNAETLKGYNNVAKGTKFTLLNFVKDYEDEYPNAIKWYRINVDGLGEGYVAASDMSVRNYQPIYTRPQTNAVIISVNGSVGAPLYEEIDGEFVISTGDQPLFTDTRVEVVGAFDVSKKYTQVKYFDENLGTLTGYVETIYLKYDGVSVLLIVVIILIILTCIGLTLTLVWRFAAKRRQITKA